MAVNPTFWQKQYEKTTRSFEKRVHNAGRVFVAFNTNIDAIKYVDMALLDFLNMQSFILTSEKGAIENMDDFRAGLLFSMRTGKAAEWVIKDMPTYDYLKKNIRYDASRIGGQAGIVSNVLASFGFKDVVVFNPSLSKEEAEYYKPDVKFPKAENGAVVFKNPKDVHDAHAEPKINLIFEFKEGMVVRIKNESFVVPRSNRFIVSYRPEKKIPHFSENMEHYFGQIFADVKRVFLSGYNSIPQDKMHYYETAKRQISKIKSINPDIKVHYEFTSEENPSVVHNMIEYVLKSVDSIGCNERELCILLKALGEEKIASDICELEYSAPSVLAGAKIVMEKLGIKRVHVHNLGYFICVTAKDYGVTPKKIRCCMLYGAEAVFTKSVMPYIHNVFDIGVNLKYRVSETGLKQIERLSMFLGADLSGGFFELDDCNIAIVPAKISEHTSTTVGLGDVVSSIAFFGELL